MRVKGPAKNFRLHIVDSMFDVKELNMLTVLYVKELKAILWLPQRVKGFDIKTALYA